MRQRNLYRFNFQLSRLLDQFFFHRLMTKPISMLTVEPPTSAFKGAISIYLA